MAVVIEGNQPIGIVDVEEDACAQHQEADPDHAREYRHEEPVDDVGDELALLPPGHGIVTGPEMGQHREYHRKHDRDGNHLLDGLAEHRQDFHRKDGHGRLIKRDA